MSMNQPFGRYTLLERIGLGGMAELFRARTTGPGGFEMEVCIKRILPHLCEDQAFVRMFIDEARVAARLRHANIVQVIDFNEVDGAYFIAMELVEGHDLKRLLRTLEARGERLGAVRAALIGAEVCRGLHYAHTRNEGGRSMQIVHRDISPHNILVSLAGEVKVADFGIAKAASRLSETSSGQVKGKVAYMSPEQARGRTVDHRTDQFATGLVLYEMLTGERAYTESSELELLRQACEGVVPRVASRWGDVPPSLEAVVARATGVKPGDRFASMEEMERALRQAIFELAPEPEAVELGGAVERLFGKSRSQRPPTELLPSVANLPPFDDEERRDGDSGSGVWRSTSSSPRSQVGETTQSTALPVHPDQTASITTTAPVSLPGALPARASSPAVSVPPPTQVRRWSFWLGVGVVVAVATVGGAGLLIGDRSPPPPARSVDPQTPGALDSNRNEQAIDGVDASRSIVTSGPTGSVSANPDVQDGGPVDRSRERPAASPGPRRGRLRVVVRDSWADVFCAGKRLGSTPLDVWLPAGKHTLRLRNPESGTSKRAVVRIGAGRTTKLVTTLEPGAE